MTCTICNRKFDSADSLSMHAAVHIETNHSHSPTPPRGEVSDGPDIQKPYQCQHCGRRFARPHEKVKHERIHTGEKPHACEVSITDSISQLGIFCSNVVLYLRFVFTGVWQNFPSLLLFDITHANSYRSSSICMSALWKAVQSVFRVQSSLAHAWRGESVHLPVLS